jgi:hypothetical protein
MPTNNITQNEENVPHMDAQSTNFCQLETYSSVRDGYTNPYSGNSKCTGFLVSSEIWQLDLHVTSVNTFQQSCKHCTNTEINPET